MQEANAISGHNKCRVDYESVIAQDVKPLEQGLIQSKSPMDFVAVERNLEVSEKNNGQEVSVDERIRA